MYKITSVGTTDFTLIGSLVSGVGVIFTATGAGSGTGTATAVRPWFDPYDCIWYDSVDGIYFNDGSVGGLPGTFTGGATLKTGMYSGAIIAHTAPLVAGKAVGAPDRHWWPNAITYRREENCPGGICDGTYLWNIYSHGAYSDGQLPNPTMRWMPGYLEAFDNLFHVASGFNAPNGTFGQQFTDFPAQNSASPQGRLVLGKYCQAVQKWPSVNFGRPCGLDRYAVDQTTVMGVASVTAGVYTVFQTGRSTNNQPAFIAKAPLASGGLQNGYYIMVEGVGVLQIATITAIGNDAKGRPNWTIAPTGAGVLDTPPTGYAFSDPAQRTDGYTHLGKLRWPTAPGICGRATVTPSYNSGAGTVTLTNVGAFKCYRKSTAANLDDLKVYDASMTLLDTITGSGITRTDDAVTFTHAAMPTAAYVVVSGYDWTKYDSSSKQTGVHIGWGFDQRAAALATGSQPAWLNGSGAGTGTGIVGCLDSGYSIGQFNYGGTMSCPAIVGIVPAGSPENFGAGQVLFDFPSVPVDSVYGAHSQSYIGLTMEDPFAQAPFKPDCDYDPTASPACPWTWAEDDGSGKLDCVYGSCPGITYSGSCAGKLQVAYYAMLPMVEALSTVPAGCSLPSGVTLFYDPANKFSPPQYPNGIPLGSAVTSDWGVADRCCSNIAGSGRFSATYATFISC